VDKVVADLRREGTPALEVADKWHVPEYWDASERPNRKHPQAYVYMDGNLKRVMWSVKPAADARPAMTAEERQARREEVRRAKLVKSARDKVRKLLEADEGTGRIALFDTERGGQAFDRIAARRLNRDLEEEWIPDALCDDVMAEYGGSDEVAAALDIDEIRAYKAVVEEGEG
jgi:hypothetical protein